MDDRPLEFWDKAEWKAIVTSWPEAVRKAIGANLRVLQHGDWPTSHCKRLKDFPIALVQLWHRSGQRVVCTTAYAELTGCIHVIDAFEKDSRERGEMRKSDRKRIGDRAKALKKRMDELQQAEKRAQSIH